MPVCKATIAAFLVGIVRGVTGSNVLASVARHALIVYTVFALTQFGKAVQLTANTFLILLGVIALAAAIVFGIGGRLVAQEILEKAYHRSSEVIGKPSTRRGDNQGRVDERPDARRVRRDE